jgi:hypothetical protein
VKTREMLVQTDLLTNTCSSRWSLTALRAVARASAAREIDAKHMDTYLDADPPKLQLTPQHTIN